MEYKMSITIHDNRGSVSVFVMLILSVILLVWLLVIDGVRMVGAKQTAAQAGHMALSSTLAGYNEALEKGYGLFALDTKLNQDSILNHYFDYNLNQFCDIDAERTSLNYNSGSAKAVLLNRSALSNNDVFNAQVYNFMKYYGNSFYDDAGYYTYGFDKISGMHKVLESKFAWDSKLSEVQEDIQNAFEPCKACSEEGYDNFRSEMQKALSDYEEAGKLCQDFENCVNSENIPDSMRDYMKTCLDNGKEIIDTDRINRAIEKLCAEDGSGYDLNWVKNEKKNDSDVEYLLSFYTDITLYSPENFQITEERNRRVIKNYTRTYFGARGTYPDTANSTFLWKPIVDLQMSRKEVLEASLENMRATAERFSDYEVVIEFLNGGLNANVMFSQYALGFFPAMSGGGSWLGGNDTMSGPLQYMSPLADLEYLLYGHENPSDNLSHQIVAIRDYIFMWEIFDAFGCDQYIRDCAADEAAVLTANNPLLAPIYTDDLLISYVLESTMLRLSQLSGQEKAVVYRADGCYLEMGYADFERLFIIYDSYNDYDSILDRMKNVIITNMRYSGYNDFTLESSITMLGMEAEVKVKTWLFGTVSFKYTNYLGY